MYAFESMIERESLGFGEKFYERPNVPVAKP